MGKRRQRTKGPSPFMQCFVDKDQYLLHQLIRFMAPTDMRSLRGVCTAIESILIQNQWFVRKAMEESITKDQSGDVQAELSMFIFKQIANNKEKYWAIRKQIRTLIKLQLEMIQEEIGKGISPIEARKIVKETLNKTGQLRHSVTSVQYAHELLKTDQRWSGPEIFDTFTALQKLERYIKMTDFYLRYRAADKRHCPGCTSTKVSIYQYVLYCKMYILPILNDMMRIITTDAIGLNVADLQQAIDELEPEVSDLSQEIVDIIKEVKLQYSELTNYANPAEMYMKKILQSKCVEGSQI